MGRLCMSVEEVAALAVVSEEINCTAQDLLQKMVSETLKRFAGCSF